MPQFTTIPGRLVWGHPLKMTPKLGDDNKPLLGPDGKPILITSFGVAFPKPEFQMHMVPRIMETVNAVYPGGAPPHFAWKLSDGDASVGHRKGKPFNQREGYPGNMVMKFETNFPINAFRTNAAGTWDQITADMFKTGDIIAVGCNLEAHKEKAGQPRSTPGLYTNPNGVLHIADGPAIVSGPDAASMFGGYQAQVPAGYMPPGSSQPQGNVNPPGMAQPVGGMPGYGAPQQAPAPQYAAPPQGGMPGYGQQPPQYAPAYDLVQGQPPQGGMPGYGQQPPQQAPMPGQMPGNGYGQPQPGGYPGQQPTQYPSNPGMPGQAPQGGMPGMPGFPQR